MMQPRLPEELITPEVVRLILRAWDLGFPQLRGVFNGLVATVLRTYVGTHPTFGPTTRQRFPRHIWSVIGMCIRTNNGAESVHSQLNPKVSGKLSLYRFLTTIEEEMMRSRKRIRAGCQSESRAGIPEKNRLLAGELHKLLNGREGVLAFLDNCASIVAMRSLRDAHQFVPARTPSMDDIVWTASNSGLVVAAARGLYGRFHPADQREDEEILRTVAMWSFQVLEDAETEDDDENISLVQTGPRRSFVDLVQRGEEVFNVNRLDRNEGVPTAAAGSWPEPQEVSQEERYFFAMWMRAAMQRMRNNELRGRRAFERREGSRGIDE